MLLLLLALACDFSSAGPCQDYCDYVCDCHDGEAGFDCDQCRVEYADADPDLQDECETELLDLQDADADAGNECDPLDTGA
jgi:hypothetical protein